MPYQPPDSANEALALCEAYRELLQLALDRLYQMTVKMEQLNERLREMTKAAKS